MLNTGNRNLVAAALTFFIIVSGTLFAGGSAKASANSKFQWDLTAVFPDWNGWETGMADVLIKIDEIVRLKGTLNQGTEQLLKMISLDEQLGILFHRVYRYPQFMLDTDLKNKEIAARFQRVKNLVTRYEAATTWIDPEILALGKETVTGWLKNDPRLSPYSYQLLELFRKQLHIPGEKQEKVLAAYSQFNDSPAAIYNEMTVTDIGFPEVTLSGGRKVIANGRNFSREMSANKNRADREKVFKAHYHAYKRYENTYAAIYRAVCQKNWAMARSRNYSSSLEYFLDQDNIPVTVYTNLVASVRADTGPLKRFHQLRAGCLELDDYRHYDTAFPFTDLSRIDVSNLYRYDRVKDLITAAVTPLGKHYRDRVRHLLSGGRVHVFPNKNKRAGAYSSNIYGLHPFILVNYRSTPTQAFTLCHEVGHALHSQISNENQTFAAHSPVIFTAEAASTLNEQLLLDHLLKQTRTPGEKISILLYAIRRIEDTFYFQTLLADFELHAHRLVEQDKPVTAETLNAIMEKLYADYYGGAITPDSAVDLAWARVHHLYLHPFYVYQYATSLAASTKLARDLTIGPNAKRAAAQKRYLRFLASGGSFAPVDLLKEAGIDLTGRNAFNGPVQRMNELVSLLERELQKKGN